MMIGGADCNHAASLARDSTGVAATSYARSWVVRKGSGGDHRAEICPRSSSVPSRARTVPYRRLRRHMPSGFRAGRHDHEFVQLVVSRSSSNSLQHRPPRRELATLGTRGKLCRQYLGGKSARGFQPVRKTAFEQMGRGAIGEGRRRAACVGWRCRHFRLRAMGHTRRRRP